MSGVAVCPHDGRMCLPKETCWGSSPEQGLGEALFAVSTLWFFLSSPLQTVVGTDIAELLLRDHRTVWLPGKSPDEANLIDFTNEAVGHTDEEESGEAQLAFLTDTQATAVAGTLEKDTERFRELLLYGRKKVGPGPTGAARGSWRPLGRLGPGCSQTGGVLFSERERLGAVVYELPGPVCCPWRWRGRRLVNVATVEGLQV